MQPNLFGGREPYRSLYRSKAKIAFGSDAAIIDLDPIPGIYAAVNRPDPGERLTVEEALRFYTIGSAYAEYQEDIKGTIEKGKLADIVILSEDLFEIPKTSIRDARVDMTIMGGEIVYDRRQLRQ
jgi:predicted amidohydrolase YtcJ